MRDANGQALAYVYARDSAADAQIAKVLTESSESLVLLLPNAVKLHWESGQAGRLSDVSTLG